MAGARFHGRTRSKDRARYPFDRAVPTRYFVDDHVFAHDDALRAAPGVVIVKSVDGRGPRGAKVHTYDALVKPIPPGVHAGFKLFFDEDTRGGAKLMKPSDVLGLGPVPDYVIYE